MSESKNKSPFGLIAGKGDYPARVLEGARSGGRSVFVVAFHGETAEAVAEAADDAVWLRLGQLGAMIRALRKAGVNEVVMAGQITPGRLFDLRPDLRALRILLSLKKRNAETLFGAVAEALEAAGIHLLPATTYLEKDLAGEGHLAGPRRWKHLRWDIETGWPVLESLGALDVGQCVVVRAGTVLAVEAYEGTNATIRRGGQLGKGKATLLKGSLPGQDFRFDVPVVGPRTIEVCREAGIRCVVVECGKTLILDPDAVRRLCDEAGITLWGHSGRI